MVHVLRVGVECWLVADSRPHEARLEQLMQAVVTVARELELSSVLRRIVQAARELATARYAALGVLGERGGLSEFLVEGIDEEAARSIPLWPEGKGVLGVLILDPRPLRLANVSNHPDSAGFPPNHPSMTSFLGVPIRVRDRVFGNLYLTEKQNAPEFTAADEELMVALAAVAGVAIENAQLHDRLAELAVLEDRERIAGDLHDTVIQRLFATGMALQAAEHLSDSDEITSRLNAAVDDLDATIRDIRSTIFALDVRCASGAGLRSRIVSLVSESTGALGFEPKLRMEGALDAASDECVGGHVLAVVREALANVARHAQATSAEVGISAGSVLTITVADDGVGPGPRRPGGRGLSSLESRARSQGGTCTFRPREGGGSLLTWCVPIAPVEQPTTGSSVDAKPNGRLKAVR